MIKAWTQEHEDALVQFYRQGISRSKIADAMNILFDAKWTKDAIHGKLWRIVGSSKQLKKRRGGKYA